MKFPLSFEDLSLWLAVIAIILLVTTQLISPHGKTSILLNKKRLRNVAFAVSTLFMIVMALQIYRTITLS
jgi:uncharacterized membrane protein